MEYEAQKQRRKERLKMTQAERWLTKMPQPRTGQAAIAHAPFRERDLPKKNVWG